MTELVPVNKTDFLDCYCFNFNCNGSSGCRALQDQVRSNHLQEKVGFETACIDKDHNVAARFQCRTPQSSSARKHVGPCALITSSRNPIYSTALGRICRITS